MQYIAARCERCGQWHFFQLNGIKTRKHWECKECEKIRIKEMWKRLNAKRRAMEKKAKIKIKLDPSKFIRTCLNCGKKFKIKPASACQQYDYCPEQECQKARLKAVRERNRIACAKTTARDLPAKPKVAKYTGKPCLNCGGPVRINYRWGREAPIEQAYCAKCRHQINLRASRGDTDWMYFDTDIEGLDGSMEARG